ncbi:MAG TPA: 3-methyladenine DNA glycosylase, partial [Epulopiscium sp.]|nr:3-methyladenine DNA glycosylase [Candidatus Epulonipiscium sp.]
MSKSLPQSFFTRDALVVAPQLLGKILVRKLGNTYIRCKIVEVEA